MNFFTQGILFTEKYALFERMGAYQGVYLRTYVPDTNDAPAQYMPPGDYSSLGVLNNRVKSITLAAWSEVLLFDDRSYKGDRILISNPAPTALVIRDLGTMSDRIRSMSVRRLK